MAAPSFRKSFVFDTEHSNDDDLANSTFSSIQNYKNYLFSERPVETGRDKKEMDAPAEVPGQLKNLFKNSNINTTDRSSRKNEVGLGEYTRNSPVSIMRF